MTSRLAAIAFSAAILTAQPLPKIEGETLSGHKVSLPDGKPAVLVIGFTHGSQTQTKAWTARVHKQFDTWSIFVLEDVPKLMRGVVSHSIKGSVAKEDQDRYVLVYHGEKELEQAAGFDRPEDAYVLVVNAAGAIALKLHGPVAEDAVQEVAAALNK